MEYGINNQTRCILKFPKIPKKIVELKSYLRK